ncbi:hypothetical protein HII31_02388, partial [Pseudocercospora fuligena]
MASTMPVMADESPAESTAQMQSVTPSYRRNGKLFSCEPFHATIGDHNSPVCGRCARRGKADQCIYHPAPLTKPRTDTPGIGPHRTAGSTPRLSTIGPYPTPSIENKQNGLVSPPSSTGTQQGKESAFRVSTSQAASLGQRSVLPSPTVPMAPTPGGESKHSSGASASYASPESAMSFIRDGRTGFLGPTSYSAVYTENSSILQTPDVEDPPDLPSLPADKIQQGNSEQMRSLSELVWRNTRRPMRVHGSMTAREWAKSASGRNLRWEVVGVVLSLVGLIAVNLSNWDTIFDSIRERYVDRATFAERMRKASEYCLCFCYESEVLNDIYVCFMFEDLVLVECLKGDAHYAAWQRTGEVCDAIVAMGLHQGNRPGPECPFFLAELRKKIFVSAYGHDKVVATFLGRPPRLSHRYCKMEYPLDLSDDQLFSEGAELEAALSTLDQNGWNTQGCLNRTTWLRVWFQHCRIREDILEIALGSDDEDIERRAQEVRQKMDHLHSSGPAHIQITPEQILSDTSSPLGVGLPLKQKKEAMRQVNAMFVLCIHTGIIHTEFLLQRALTIRTRTDTKKLIPIARRMLKLVLLAQSRRDFFRDFQGDIIYLLALHGLPAAGVLAVELLIESQTRQYAPEVLPRSETIQDLSVFISALGSVGPGEGNYSICNQGRKALARVLDQILSPNPPPPVSTSGEQPIFDDSSVLFPIGNDADFLSWLENVEWDKNNWIDQPPPSMAGPTEPPVQ